MGVMLEGNSNNDASFGAGHVFSDDEMRMTVIDDDGNESKICGCDTECDSLNSARC